MQVTCGQLKAWLEKMPTDARIRFALDDDRDNSQETLEFKECFPNGNAYHILLERKQS